MNFEKWHGIGNDFLIVTQRELDTRAQEHGDGDAPYTRAEDGRVVLDTSAVIGLCDRHFGVGGDGILVLGPSQVADASMRIHNADGSMAEMCGNGIRVAARYLVERGLVQPGQDGSFSIETQGGIMRPTLLEDGRVRVDMGRLETDGIIAIDVEAHSARGTAETLEGRVVSVGNPHFVIRRAPEGPALHQLGPLAEVHPRFPNRTNVEFWEIDDAGAGIVRMRVWERGCGETLACGTGACAVAFTARADAPELASAETIVVRLAGGELEVGFDGDRATMTGAAHHAWSAAVDPAAVVSGLPAHQRASTRLAAR